jgi:hypothetical protein
MDFSCDDEFVLTDIELSDGEYLDINCLIEVDDNLNDSLLNEFVNEGE